VFTLTQTHNPYFLPAGMELQMKKFKNRLMSIIVFLGCSSAALALNLPQDKSDIMFNLYRNQVAHFYGLKSSNNFTLLKIKGYQQTEDYTSAPAAVMALMNYYEKLPDSEMNKETELKIAAEMGISKSKGSSLQKIIKWLKKHDFKVTSGENGTIDLLKENIQKNIPTIIEWVDWGGNWVIASGYDTEDKSYIDNKDTILLTDPRASSNNVKYMNGITTINPNRFASMWFDMKYSKHSHLVKGVYIVAVPKD